MALAALVSHWIVSKRTTITKNKSGFFSKRRKAAGAQENILDQGGRQSRQLASIVMFPKHTVHTSIHNSFLIQIV